MERLISKQKLVEPKRKDRREGKGRVLALSYEIYSIGSGPTYYVESEGGNNYYFVRFNPSVFERCSCKDFASNRSKRCKHLYAIEYAIRFNTIRVVDRLPEWVKVKRVVTPELSSGVKPERWEDDIYDF